MNEFSTKTNMNTGVDRLISWFSCWYAPRFRRYVMLWSILV